MARKNSKKKKLIEHARRLQQEKEEDEQRRIRQEKRERKRKEREESMAVDNDIELAARPTKRRKLTNTTEDDDKTMAGNDQPVQRMEVETVKPMPLIASEDSTRVVAVSHGQLSQKELRQKRIAHAVEKRKKRLSNMRFKEDRSRMDISAYQDSTNSHTMDTS